MALPLNDGGVLRQSSKWESRTGTGKWRAELMQSAVPTPTLATEEARRKKKKNLRRGRHLRDNVANPHFIPRHNALIQIKSRSKRHVCFNGRFDAAKRRRYCSGNQVLHQRDRNAGSCKGKENLITQLFPGIRSHFLKMSWPAVKFLHSPAKVLFFLRSVHPLRKQRNYQISDSRGTQKWWNTTAEIFITTVLWFQNNPFIWISDRKFR